MVLQAEDCLPPHAHSSFTQMVVFSFYPEPTRMSDSDHTHPQPPANTAAPVSGASSAKPSPLSQDTAEAASPAASDASQAVSQTVSQTAPADTAAADSGAAPAAAQASATAQAPGQAEAPQAPGSRDDVLTGDGSELEISHPDNALMPVSLDQLPPAMQAACARAGWTRLMPVQSLALPYLMDGRDIMIQSRTGSGKTGCYLLPLVPALRPDQAYTQALVLVPTRELALQVAEQARILFDGTSIRSAALYGGVGYGKQLEQLREGAHLVIGTPGRILDHILRHSLNLEHLRALVFDEADRMLSIGFYPDMKELQRYLPRKRIYTSLFSATYPPYVISLAHEFMTSPSLLSLSQKQVYVAEVQHYVCQVQPMDKDRALIRLIEMENPASAIIFCNTKANVHYVTGVLQGFGYNADELSADLSQNRREDVMRRVRENKVRFLVATDVAARGIDIPCLSHVFLYEPPEDHESYIHRAGRTGRANAAGTVISLCDIMQRMELDRIAKHYSLHLQEMANPTDEAVAEVVSSRLLTLLESRFRSLTSLEKVRTRRYSELARTLATMPEDEESEGSGVSLLAMLLDAFHHNTLNALSLPKDRQPRGERLEKAAKSSKQERRKNDGRKDKKRQNGSRDASRDASRGPSADTPQADDETAPAAPAENGVQAEETAPARQKGQGKKKKKSGSGSAKSAGKNAQDKPKKSSRPIFLGNDAGLQDETPVTPESQGMESPSAAQDRSDKKKTSRKRKRRHKKGPSEGQEAGMHASEAQGDFDDMEVPF